LGRYLTGGFRHEIIKNRTVGQVLAAMLGGTRQLRDVEPRGTALGSPISTAAKRMAFQMQLAVK